MLGAMPRPADCRTWVIHASAAFRVGKVSDLERRFLLTGSSHRTLARCASTAPLRGSMSADSEIPSGRTSLSTIRQPRQDRHDDSPTKPRPRWRCTRTPDSILVRRLGPAGDATYARGWWWRRPRAAARQVRLKCTNARLAASPLHAPSLIGWFSW